MSEIAPQSCHTLCRTLTRESWMASLTQTLCHRQSQKQPSCQGWIELTDVALSAGN